MFVRCRTWQDNDDKSADIIKMLLTLVLYIKSIYYKYFKSFSVVVLKPKRVKFVNFCLKFSDNHALLRLKVSWEFAYSSSWKLHASFHCSVMSYLSPYANIITSFTTTNVCTWKLCCYMQVPFDIWNRNLSVMCFVLSCHNFSACVCLFLLLSSHSSVMSLSAFK